LNKIILEKLAVFNPQLVMVFGSYAKKTQTPQSDLDIAFWSDKELSSYEIWLLAQQIAMELNIDIDLVNLKDANDVLKFQVATTGIILLNNNMDSFLDKCYTDYFQLNDDRKEILDYYGR